MYADANGNAQRVLLRVSTRLRNRVRIRLCVSAFFLGAVMSPHASVQGSNELPTSDLRLKRVHPGDEFIFRALTGKIPGCLTHWEKKRSRYCGAVKPSDCQHRADAYWKGYCPVEVWSSDAKLWLPFVLEVTEHLEHALRQQYARGTIWKVERDEQMSGRKTPVRGTLLETRDHSKWPKAFIIDACLHNVYHCPVQLNAANPVPMVPKVQASNDAPPLTVEEQEQNNRPMTTDDDRMKRFRIEQIKRGQIPRGRYPELDAIAFATIPITNGTGHTNGNGRST